MVRARFCELLSPEIQHEDSDLFLMGMRSLMDTILKIPMRQVREKVPIDQDSKDVLLGATGPLQPFYQLILAQESGDWRVASALTAQLHLSEADIADAYWQAMQWARHVGSGKYGRRRAISAGGPIRRFGTPCFRRPKAARACRRYFPRNE
jgi:c-di-GMP-related signal transduction protein